jgi:hypothetical protein
VHKLGRDDEACAVVAIAHDASAHRIGSFARPPVEHSQHCYTCHWLRSLGSLVPTDERIVADSGAAASLARRVVPSRDRLDFGGFSPGAPPGVTTLDPPFGS